MAANYPNDPESPVGPESKVPPPIPGPQPRDRLRYLAATPREADYAPAYTRLVRRLRILLPIAGLATIAVVALWPRIQTWLNHPTQLTEQDRRARMVAGRFVGADSHGRPYTVTYDTAEQPPNGGPVDMVNPLAELTLDNGRWVAVRAMHGRYDQAAGLIDLSGHVELFHDGGYRFTTDRAHVEFSKDLIWGDRAVEGHGPKGQILARGFRIANKGQTIAFTGPAKLLMRPDAAQLPEPDDSQ
jgi:lipopolysaccharide export system protein LptC